MPESVSQPAQIRIVTVHLIAMLLGLAGTALILLQGRYWLTEAADSRVLILTACVPLIAAVAFAIAPRHAAEDHSVWRPLRSWLVWGNLLAPVALTVLTLALITASGHFEDFAGFAMLLAANAGRNLRDLLHHLRHAAS
jgi:drug/metabolite transporter (DMT)-like permease